MGKSKCNTLRSPEERAFASALPEAQYEPCTIEYTMKYKPDFFYAGYFFEIKGFVNNRNKAELNAKLLASNACLVVIVKQTDYYEWKINQGAYKETTSHLRSIAIAKWAQEHGHNCVVSTIQTIKADIDAWIVAAKHGRPKAVRST